METMVVHAGGYSNFVAIFVDDASWTWFIEQLKEAYGDGENMCVVSESIIKSVSRVYNLVPHYACI
ncbi:hypothetical protein HAX54_047246 [Datura stramonium]|uniref:Uncharacterized protein n=1 Tax=Datura stramonium TaxID=4076 RepID=A0ABS8RQ87_DATST|nr:hypothetical protein [Datura stramonium]